MYLRGDTIGRKYILCLHYCTVILKLELHNAPTQRSWSLPGGGMEGHEALNWRGLLRHNRACDRLLEVGEPCISLHRAPQHVETVQNYHDPLLVCDDGIRSGSQSLLLTALWSPSEEPSHTPVRQLQALVSLNKPLGFSKAAQSKNYFAPFPKNFSGQT